jgi:signal peptidase I
MTVELVLRYAKILAGFVVVWVVMWVFNTYGCQRVEGDEMEPTIPRDKPKIITPKIHRPDQLERGDIVSFIYNVPGRSTRPVAARVIGLPGERVRIEKGDVFVNDAKVGGEYVSAANRSNDDYAEVIVPRDTVFVLCDRRKVQIQQIPWDSRGVGPVPMWAILGTIGK